jgi:hypothetical protein
MILKVPVYKKEIYSEEYSEYSVKNTIPGLECLEPFVCAKWKDFIIYTTESLCINSVVPGAYIIPFNNNDIRLFSYEKICIGSFYDAISSKEKYEFRENIVEIFKLLRIK